MRTRTRTHYHAIERTAQRGYGGRWQRARLGFLRSHPHCRMCESIGQQTRATVVDHIKPHGGDPFAFWDPTNWQPLCKPCHDLKTGREMGGKRPFNGKPRPIIGIDGYPISPLGQ